MSHQIWLTTTHLKSKQISAYNCVTNMTQSHSADPAVPFWLAWGSPASFWRSGKPHAPSASINQRLLTKNSDQVYWNSHRVYKKCRKFRCLDGYHSEAETKLLPFCRRIFKCIFLMKMYEFRLRFQIQIQIFIIWTNWSAIIWTNSLLTHICVTRP